MRIQSSPWLSRLLTTIVPLVLLLTAGCGTTNFRDLADGRLDKAREIIRKNGYDPNETFQGTTPLMFAAVHGDAELVRELLQMGAKIGTQDRNGSTAAHFAAVGVLNPGSPRQRLETLRTLIARGESLTAVNVAGYSLLHAALAFDSPDASEVASYLLGVGVPADLATTKKNFQTLMKTLARTMADQPVGMTALMFAARLEQPAVVKSLLERNVNVATLDADSWNALMHAADEARTLNANLLLAAGAMPQRADESARAVQAYGRAHYFAGVREIGRGSKERSVEHLRLAAETLDAAAARHTSEGNVTAMKYAALSALSFIAAGAQARINARQMASISPDGRGFGMAPFTTLPVGAPLQAGASRSQVATAEASSARMTLDCVTGAADAAALLLCAPQP